MTFWCVSTGFAVAACLVVDHAQLGAALGGEAPHRLDKVLAGRPEDPGRSHDDVAPVERAESSGGEQKGLSGIGALKPNSQAPATPATTTTDSSTSDSTAGGTSDSPQGDAEN